MAKNKQDFDEMMMQDYRMKNWQKTMYDQGGRNPRQIGVPMTNGSYSNPSGNASVVPSAETDNKTVNNNLNLVADKSKSNAQAVQNLGGAFKGAVDTVVSDVRNSYVKDLGNYNNGLGGDNGNGFKPSNTYLQAMQYTQSLLDKLSSGRTSYSDKLDDIMAQISGRDKFTYDFNTDPMFLSALQSSMNQGRLAMQDTMGQASALTGGYGSSYGQAVGNQAYNAEIQKAYDNLPEFYGMALDAYNNETQGLLNQLDMYGTADANEYDRLANAYASNAQAAAQLYDQEYNNFWQNKNFDYQMGRDAVSDALSYAKLSGDASELKAPTSSILADAVLAYNKGVEAYSDFTDRMEAQGYNIDLIDSHVEQNGQLPLADLEFTKVKETKNGLGGVDRNDKVEASNGQTYTLAELQKLLEEQGMSREKAKQFVLTLTNLEVGKTYSRY